MLPDQKEFDACQGIAEEVECNGKNTGFGVKLDLYTDLIQFNIEHFTECQALFIGTRNLGNTEKLIIVSRNSQLGRGERHLDKEITGEVYKKQRLHLRKALTVWEEREQKRLWMM